MLPASGPVIFSVGQMCVPMIKDLFRCKLQKKVLREIRMTNNLSQFDELEIWIEPWIQSDTLWAKTLANMQPLNYAE